MDHFAAMALVILKTFAVGIEHLDDVEERDPELDYAIAPEADEVAEELRPGPGKGPFREGDEVLGIEINPYRLAVCHRVVLSGYRRSA
jgi:hypothetical protein